MPLCHVRLDFVPCVGVDGRVVGGADDGGDVRDLGWNSCGVVGCGGDSASGDFAAFRMELTFCNDAGDATP